MNIGALGISGQSTAVATLTDLSDRLKTAKAQKANAQKADAQKAADQLRDLPKKTRDDARAQARARVMQLVERLKIIKKLGEADPKLMAKMLAQLMKELKAAVKDYAKAGGNTSDVAGFSAAQSAASAPAAETPKETPEEPPAETSGEPATGVAKVPETADAAVAETTAKEPTDQAPTPPTPSDSRAAAEAYVKTTRALAEGELLEVNDFMKQVRGLVKAVKDLFETAKIKLAFQTVDKDTVEAFRSSGEDMKEIEDTLDALDHDLNDERAVYGPRAALYA